MNRVFISLGSNLGNRISNIEKAYAEIEAKIGRIELKSSFYKTPPWGFQSEEEFVNSLIRVETGFELKELLAHLKTIEQELGRKKKGAKLGYQDRLIDLDIIDYDNLVYSSDLITVPHERMHLRNFVIFPLHEIAPNWIHPKLNKTVETLKKPMLNDPSIVKIEHLSD
ncbi:MAG: 2-amino-4-hydroxy-6-hydroxymethyldihydropteridine diphosphokinase [Crocinitomix sp.]|nr:2-amino-4-hydroxy-6-hydroxymethyldihydropteridine diphosphokinase [Crocinitomix sp.]